MGSGVVYLIAAILGIIVVAAAVAFLNPAEDEVIPLVEIQRSSIWPPSDFVDNSSHIKNGDSAIITVNVQSISNEYDNNAKIITTFAHPEASEFFVIENPEVNVGILQRSGASSGPLEIKITAIATPAKTYTETIKVELVIENDIHDSRVFDISIKE